MTTESEKLGKSLAQLAQCEQLMGDAEKEVEIYRIKKTQGLYEKRRTITKDIPQFWYIVLAENDDFSEYIRAEDLKYLDFVSDIFVHYKVVDTGDIQHYRDFSITISFKDETGTVPSQTITKEFMISIDDGEEVIRSKPVDVQWPTELSSICPSSIRRNKLGTTYNQEEKKLYRQGMKSFFAWFEWTGTKPGKEFKNGEDLTRLIIDDLFPNAVKYYVEAVRNDQESEADSSEGEELDLSDDEQHVHKRVKTETLKPQ